MTVIRNYVGLVPARSGSKGIPDKNIRKFGGYPLIYYSITQGLNVSALRGEVYIATDSAEYEKIGREYGAKSLGLRSSASSGDSALDIDVFKEFLILYKLQFGIYPDALVHLRPTYPIRDVNIIAQAIKLFDSNFNYYDSLRSMVLAKDTAYKMWLIEDNKENRPVSISIGKALTDIPDVHSAPRQSLPSCYIQNACIDIIKTSTIIEKNSVAGDHIYPFIMNGENLDIDTEKDFILASEKLKKG